MKRIIHNTYTKKNYTPPSIYIEDIEPWEMIAGSATTKGSDMNGEGTGNGTSTVVPGDDGEVPEVPVGETAKSGFLWEKSTFDIEDDYEYEY